MEDDIIEIEQAVLTKDLFTLNIVKLSEIPEINEFLNSKTNSNFFKQSNGKNGAIFDQENIMEVIDTLNQTNYSFRFSYPNTPQGTFYNLVVGKTSDGETKEPFVLKFISDETQLEKFINNNNDFSFFKGKVAIHKYTDFFENDNFYKSDTYCPPSFDEFGDPIPCEDLTIDGSNTSGSSGLGSDGGGYTGSAESSGSGSADGNSSSSGGNSGSSGGGSSCSWAYENIPTRPCPYTDTLASCLVPYFVIDCNYKKSTIVKKSDINCPDCPNPAGVVGVNTTAKIFNKLIGKELCLHDLLDKNGNTFIKDLLDNFKGESEFDIEIESKDKVYKDNEEVAGTTTSPINGFIRIKISTSVAASRPALAVVRTILHEYIHADIFRKLKTKYPTSGELEFKTTYEAFENGNFKASSGHETMASLYIDEMSKTLKEFHKNSLKEDYNYLTNNGINPLPDGFYRALAWQGLKEQGVQAYIDLTDVKKTELQNSLNEYYHSTTKNCPEIN